MTSSPAAANGAILTPDQQLQLVERTVDAFLDDVATRPGSPSDVWARQFDAGLAWVDFPVGLGGLGLPRNLRAIVATRLTGAGVPDSADTNGIGVSLAAPVLMSHGTVEHQQRHLRPLFTGAEIWCQLFSEPGAGSDLASLATAARRDGPSYVINGQKVWTTLGHVARWGLLCARTDPDAPKHAGLSMFILDMHAPGVDCRPIRQITGDAEFNEVFFSDVTVAETQRVGAEGDGWSSILATLANERAVFAATPYEQGDGAIGDAIALWREHGHARPDLRDRFMRLWVRAEAVRVSETAAIQSEQLGTPSPAWSYLKVMRSELEQDIFSFCVLLLGHEGLRYPSYAMKIPTRMNEGRGAGADVRTSYLFARAATIAGGTSEVQRTIIADRVLRLPRESGIDKNTPWREIRRS